MNTFIALYLITTLKEGHIIQLKIPPQNIMKNIVKTLYSRENLSSDKNCVMYNKQASKRKRF